ncbi:hypothetical protein TBLA_0B10030 [Henningerozyma blattae CBS 6284]|uniref:Protein kinase domain-containing protein n=1 Tax=Henningerozyma blattae (strain ATCC 34711 / CBS 6284 / DSM 70876 / NBRC 10599 / NRRL Y-10934 / UCD 77-7) TaxID=1071380 RepID=I2H0B8_HENB6|nr:hypothetical protein TBLA_0B10030 [Tetrapisispora blattae CBS 6284]CCH59820.1 hypothetical protein TBLA_0B10030 [Tetrapisispora blattae CBS 6284]
MRPTLANPSANANTISNPSRINPPFNRPIYTSQASPRDSPASSMDIDKKEVETFEEEEEELGESRDSPSSSSSSSDDVIFIKEQQIHSTSPSVNTTYYTPLPDNYSYTLPSSYRKQRTISLPQLPFSRLAYETANYMSPRVERDDDLIHLTGSSSKTLSGNRSVNLKLLQTPVPDITVLESMPLTSANSNSVSPMSITNASTNAMSNTTAYYSGSNSAASTNSSGSSSSSSSNTTTGGVSNVITKKSSLKKNSLKRIKNPPKLTSKLIIGKKQRTIKDNFKTDKDGHYIYKQNDTLANNKYIVKALLGQGTFGKVLKCLVNEQGEPHYVAIKVIKSIDRYREAAKTELRILKAILTNDPQGIYQCLLLKDCFDYKNHVCFITELYGRSIYDFMCSNGIARFPGSHVQAIARQLIRSICFLHDLGIIHTDLKPENILLIDESTIDYPLPPNVLNSISLRRKTASNGKRKILTNPEIKLIDFGSAIFHDEYHPPIISTRHYRAPEIVLGLGWSYPCDVWSIGCVLVELVTGESLYPIHENLEHMAMMERVNGLPFPPKLIDKMFFKIKNKLGNLPADLNSTVVKHFNDDTLQLQWPEKNSKGQYITSEKSMHRVMDGCSRLDLHISNKLKLDYGDAFNINWNLSPDKNWNLITCNLQTSSSLDKETFLFWYWFLDLSRKLFEFDPTKRITAKDALNHPWFGLGILDQGIAIYEQRA